MTCCQGVFIPGGQSYCSTQTRSNWTNSPQPYCSLEEPLRRSTALLLIIQESNTRSAPLHPSYKLFWFLVTKEGCGEAKKMVLKLYYVFFVCFQKVIHRNSHHASGCELSQPQRERYSINPGHWCQCFGSFFTTTSLSYQIAHHSDLVCGWSQVQCSLGTSNTGESLSQ